MRKTFFVVVLAALLVIPNAFSQQEQQAQQTSFSDSVTFYTDANTVRAYQDFISQEHATPSSQQALGGLGQVIVPVGSGPVSSTSLAGSGGFVKCAENSLSDKALGREIDQVISMKASGLVTTCLLCGLIEVESGFKPRVVSSAGARGLTQLMNFNYRRCGLDDESVLSVEQNIDCGARYLSGRIMDHDGSVERGLAAYFCGSCANSRTLGSTARGYISKVLNAAARFKQNGLC